MRTYSRFTVFALLAVALLATAPVSAREATPEQGVLRVQFLTPTGTVEPNPSDTPLFSLFTRSISRPLPRDQGETKKSGEFEIPFELGSREMALDATASVTDPRSRHLAEVTVLGLHDRTVKLRLTTVGTPLPPFTTTAGPYPKDEAPTVQGQALVTVRLDVVVLPRQD